MIVPMWRQFRLLPFMTLATVISLVLTLTMVAFTYLLFLNLFAQSFSRSLLIVLVVLGIVTLTVTLLTVTQVMYLTATNTQERHLREQTEIWEERLRLYMRGGPMPRPLSRVGQDLLLQWREAQPDDPGTARLMDMYGFLGLRARDEAEATDSLNPNVRALALERLVLLRDPASLPTLLRLLGDPRESVRNLALIGVARVIPGSAADLLTLLEPLTSGQFTAQQVREALCVIGNRAEPLVRAMAGLPLARWRELAVDTATRLDAGRYGALAQRLLDDPDVGVRAGALRLCAHEGRLSPEAGARVLILSGDAAWPVRAMAAQALGAVHPPPESSLWTLLGDPHWWVRRNAAQSLSGSAAGRVILRRAVTEHPDRFARDMAGMVDEAV